MKSIAVLCLALLLTISDASPASAQSGADLFQQALQMERVEGDLKAAIALYQRILEEHAADRALSAKVLVQLGQAYEKMGNSDARTSYQRVIRDYADQPEQVTMARARLDALSASATRSAGAGPTVRRLWSGDDIDATGAPTRDGRLLTFVDWTFGDLALRDLSTGQNRLLTNKGTWGDLSFPLNSTPSPDGRRVAYGWSGDMRRSDQARQFELRLIGIDGGEPRVLYADPEVVYGQPSEWSPDGRQIVTMLARTDHATQIALIGATDGAVRVLKTLDPRGPGKMSFSPDGRYVVYDRPPGEDAEQRDIYVLATDGSAESALVQHPAQDVVMGWAPDGRHVLFASDRTGDMSVWLAPVANGKPAGEPMLVRRDPEFATAVPMGFTQNGAFLYGVNASASDIYVAPIDPTTGKAKGVPALMLNHFVGANRSADWTRDGTAALYMSRRQPGPETDWGSLVVRSLATGAERVLPTPLDGLRPPRWSPDGRYIVAKGRDRNGRPGLFRVDPQSGEATMLVEGGGRWFAGWSADATSIIYWIQNMPQPLAIVSQRLDTGESKTLFSMEWKPQTNLYAADVSPDGRQVAFVSFPDPGARTTLHVVSSEGGETRTLFQAPEEYHIGVALAWSTDGRYVFFELSNGNDHRLMRVAATGGPAQETDMVIGGRIAHLRMHPDGQRLSFTLFRDSGEVWIMEDFLPKPESPAGGRQR
ncbi:MAG: tetratricopeptide repeat protein [Longimicrobiales bacterium]|nr:tetratricopeptide repeat protein [Longimicrobiales bacterium]